MGVAHAAYRLARETPLRNVVPTRLQNFVYMQFIRELTYKHMALTRPEEILQTAPVQCDRSSDLKLWLLTSRNDILMAVWCLKSLFLYSKSKWDVYIADSGNITHEQMSLLQCHFPGIRILARSYLDARSVEPMKHYPNSSWLRHIRKFPLALKLFDPIFNLDEGLFLLLDSDILFFQEPSELLSALRSSGVNLPFRFNVDSSGKINTGLAVIDKTALNLTEIERALSLMNSKQRNSWWVEQDIYTEIAKDKYLALSSLYSVQPIDENFHSNVTSCHYIGVCRPQFFNQGVNRLRQQRFLQESM